MQNIFVGNLSATTSEQAVRDAFEPFGKVLTVHIVRDRDSDATRGFAFVEMDTEAEAKEAVDKLDGKLIDGNVVRVNEARPKESNHPDEGLNTRSHRQHRY